MNRGHRSAWIVSPPLRDTLPTEFFDTWNSSVVELLVQKGFRVRGVGRNAAKSLLFKEKLDSTYGKGTFEFVEVADFTVEGVFDNAIQGEHTMNTCEHHLHF